MCIIIVKPKKQNIPSGDILENCFTNNPDGAGIMYPYENQVKIIKGLMTIEDLLNAISEIKNEKEIPVVIHFRYATHGDKSPGNTHPFPLSGDFKELQKVQNLCNRAMCHNGIMHQYGDKNATLSDSAFFAKLLSGLMTDRSIKRALEAHETGNKFVVLSPDSIIRIGNFTKYKKCFYSNTSYEKREIITTYTPVTTIKNLEEYEDFWQKYYTDKNFKDFDDIENYWQNKRKTVQLRVIPDKDGFRKYLDNNQMVKL